MTAEPCIYLSADGVYVSTRYKRALCKGLSGPLKAVKDVEKVVSELAPDKAMILKRRCSGAFQHAQSLWKRLLRNSELPLNSVSFGANGYYY